MSAIKGRSVVYTDTSFLVSLFVGDSHTESARVLVSEREIPILVNSLLELEFMNAIGQRVFRGEMSEDQALTIRRLWCSEFEKGRLVRDNELSAKVWERARQLSCDYTGRMGGRSLDILHVAVALEIDADVFWSFDKKQSKLAEVVGMQINPL